MYFWLGGVATGLGWVAFWPSLPPENVSILLLCGAMVLLRSGNTKRRLISGVLLGSAIAIVYGHGLLATRLEANCVKVPLTVTGVVASLPMLSTLGNDVPQQRFELRLTQLSPRRCIGPTRLLLSYYGAEPITPGDQWQFEVVLKKPWGLANPGSYNAQAWFAQRGIDAVGSVRNSPSNHRLSWARGFDGALERLRQKISRRIAQLSVSADVQAVLQALTVADKSALHTKLWHAFQAFGINHLLVISGLHVGLVAGVGFVSGTLLSRLIPGVCTLGSWLPAVAGVSLAIGYAALAGFSLPTQRALCMLICISLATLAGRRGAASRNLLVAALVVLLLNPLAVLGSGFWLSFGAVAFLLWLARWQQGYGVTARLLRTHGFMSLLMLPLGAWFFSGVSLISMAANLLMIPLIGLYVVPLALIAVVGFLCAAPWESLFWRLAAWPLEQLLPLAIAGAERPGQTFYQALFAPLPEVLLGLCAVTLLILPLNWQWKLLAAVLALPLTLPLTRPEKVTSDVVTARTEVFVLDVGQGTSVVIQSGGRTLLYDTGGGDPLGNNLAVSAVLPFLQTRGVRALDTLIISHPDLDHAAGLGDILQALPVARYRRGGVVPDIPGHRPCLAGEAWRWPGGQEFQFLSPPRGIGASSNNSSCVLQVQIGQYRMLLTGDIESGREQELAQYWRETLGSQWLLVAHHGSKTSTSWTFLKHVKPEVATISNGYGNRFGHPHSSVVKRLDQYRAQVLSTAISGALTFTIEPDSTLRIEHFRATSRYYWM